MWKPLFVCSLNGLTYVGGEVDIRMPHTSHLMFQMKCEFR